MSNQFYSQSKKQSNQNDLRKAKNCTAVNYQLPCCMQKNGKLENKAHKLWDKFSAEDNEGFWASYNKLLAKAKKKRPTLRLPRLPKSVNSSAAFKQKPITNAKKQGIHAPVRVTKAVLLTLVLFGITCLFFFVPFWLNFKVESAEKQDEDLGTYSLPTQLEKLQKALEDDNPQKTEQWLRAQLSPAEKDTLANFAERFPELTHTRLVKHYMYMYGLPDYSKAPFNLTDIESHQVYRLYSPGDTVVWYTKAPQKAPQRVIKKGDSYYIKSGDATLKKVALGNVYRAKLELAYQNQPYPIIKHLLNPAGQHRKYQWFYVNQQDTILIKPPAYDAFSIWLTIKKIDD